MCNGSTSDSGSDCGGSNPPWGTHKTESEMIQFFYGSFEYRFSSSPSQGGETGSTPVGAKRSLRISVLFADSQFIIENALNKNPIGFL